MKVLNKSAKKFIKPFALLCFAALAVPFAWSQMTESSQKSQNEPILIRVSLPDERQKIASTLFGSFLEPIGHSTYGGLWANVVENPSFEEGLWSA
jgi:alpha-N-arabinofuranosidase